MKTDAGSAHSRKKRVFLIDDHPLVREGLATVIDQQDDLMVCGQAESAPEALATVGPAKPDVAIVDISLEDGSGLELIKDLRAHHPALPMLALSMHDETLYAERALRAGARGYVMKRVATGEVLASIRKVLSGGFAVSDEMAGKLVGKLVTAQPPSRSAVDQLSDRELEVFELLGQGRSTREIADRLHLGIKTVSTHRQNIKTKLKLSNATELVRHAVRWAASRKAD